MTMMTEHQVRGMPPPILIGAVTPGERRHIAFVGPRGAGKTTAANIAVRDFGHKRVSLAEPVKQATVSMLNGFLADQGDDRRVFRDDLDSHKAVFRPVLEWLGTTFARDFIGTPDRWIDLFLREVESAGMPVVCDDVRHPNEAEALSRHGFTIVRIVRDEHERQRFLLSRGEPAGAMASEVDIDLIEADVLIVNRGDLSQFAHDVRSVLRDQL